MGSAGSEAIGFDVNNDDHWEAYLRRQQAAENRLRELYKNTPKLPLKPLPRDINFVRPFLSSTFRDFNEERNLSFKSAFPQVEKKLIERGIFFSPLDLRWGITTEQSASGEVVRICLEEVDRCRPYFVCSLGFRNGWSLSPTDDPEADHVKLLVKTLDIGQSAFPWIANHRDKSVTELEVLHGILNDPEAALRPYVYFRSVRYLRSIPKAERGVFAELGWAEERLLDLKERIIKAGLPVKWFDTPAMWAELVRNDLCETIAIDFPPGQGTPLEMEIKDHATFAASRTRCFIGRQQSTQILDDYVTNGGQPILVVADSGLGKTSLLANFVATLRSRRASKYAQHQITAQQDSTLHQRLLYRARGVLDRYIGSTSESAHSPALIRTLMEELKETYSLDLEMPQSAQELMVAFPDWLEAASHKCGDEPLVIVVDGLNQLAGDQDALFLSWVPTQMPPNARLILSTIPGHATEERLLEDGFKPVRLGVLLDEEARSLSARFLGLFGKSLDAAQTDRVMLNPRTRNPLYLSTFLQELRVFGSYEALGAKIDYYMAAADVTDMFLKVISHLEEDFASVPGLVQWVLCLLAVARVGLTEAELQNALKHILAEPDRADFQALMATYTPSSKPVINPFTGGLSPFDSPSSPKAEVDGSPVSKGASDPSQARTKTSEFPTIEFASLMIRLEEHLVDQRGLKRVSHSYLLDAIALRYFGGVREAPGAPVVVPAKNPTRALCHRVLADCFHTTAPSPRKAQELPWHIYVLCIFSGFTTNAPGIIPHTEVVESKSSTSTGDLGLVKELVAVLTDWQLFSIFTSSEFKFDLHRYWSLCERADPKFEPSKAYYRAIKEYESRASTASDLDFGEKCRAIGYFLTMTDRAKGADVFLAQAIRIFEAALGSRHPELEVTLSYSASLSYKLGDYKEALEKYSRCLEILKHNPAADKRRSALLRMAIANLYKEQGQYEEALTLYETALEEQKKNVGPESVAVGVTLSNIADLQLRRDRPDLALPLYEHSLRIMESHRGVNHPTVAAILSSTGSALNSLKRHAEARAVFKRAMKIKERVLGAGHVGTSAVLNNLAVTYFNEGLYSEALSLYEKSLKIQENAYGPEHIHLVNTLCNIAHVYSALAEREMNEAHTRPPPASARQGRRRSSAGSAQGDATAAVAAAAQEQEQKEQQQLEGGEANLSRATQDVNTQLATNALLNYERALSIVQAHPGAATLQTHVEILESLGKMRAMVGLYMEALVAYQSIIDLYSQHNNGVMTPEIADVLNTQAQVAVQMGNIPKALKYHMAECEALETLYGEKDPRVATVLSNMATLYLDLNGERQALICLLKCYAIRKHALGVDHPDTLDTKGWLFDLAVDEELTLEEFDPDTYQFLESSLTDVQSSQHADGDLAALPTTARTVG